MKHHS